MFRAIIVLYDFISFLIECLNIKMHLLYRELQQKGFHEVKWCYFFSYLTKHRYFIKKSVVSSTMVHMQNICKRKFSEWNENSWSLTIFKWQLWIDSWKHTKHACKPLLIINMIFKNNFLVATKLLWLCYCKIKGWTGNAM